MAVCQVDNVVHAGVLTECCCTCMLVQASDCHHLLLLRMGKYI
jgi:hypothetical protein